MAFHQKPNCVHPLIEWVDDEECTWRIRRDWHYIGDRETAYYGPYSGPICDLPRNPTIERVHYNSSPSADCVHDVERVRAFFCPECGEKLGPQEPLRGK